MTEPTHTWPISMRVEAGRTYLGIFDRLGDGRAPHRADSGPALEEIGGEEWTTDVLTRLLPSQRTWAWWTQTAVYRKSGLDGRRAPRSVDVSRLSEVLVESLVLKRMSLALIPPGAVEARSAVSNWAAWDTEQIPDHIWTAPDGTVTWDLEQIAAWCLDPKQWGNLRSAASQPAERIVTMFDGQIHCTMTPPTAHESMHALDALARQWGLKIVAGPTEYAWAAPRRV
jgi:hypothetical protein